MPYKSAKQRAYMHAKLPGIAKRWDADYGGRVVKGSKVKPHPSHARKAKEGKR